MESSVSYTMTDEFELFECKVCLELILDKKPRTLTCNHTFCQVFLTELLHKKTSAVLHVKLLPWLPATM